MIKLVDDVFEVSSEMFDNATSSIISFIVEAEKNMNLLADEIVGKQERIDELEYLLSIERAKVRHLLERGK